MSRIYSFAPIARPDAKLLILGSMPGAASLAAGQYYAHRRNAFWPIMAQLLQFDAAAPYAERVAALQTAGIAVWDVLQSCTRVGSLDADIDDTSLIANDLVGFLQQYAAIERVFFNGSKAEACFRKWVGQGAVGRNLIYQRLPSTSPAHAALAWEGKLAAWRGICIDGQVVTP